MRRPGYREARPVRWWTAMVGVGVSMLFFLLITLASRSVAGFIVDMVAGVLVAAGAAWVLVARGDRGAGVGIAIVAGCALSVITVVGGHAVWTALSSGVG